jgi:predicted choloylglycine hydrolase
LVAEFVEAYITIDDTEVLLKQNEGKRAMVFCSRKDAETQSHKESVAELVEATTTNNQNPTSVRFILEDNYVLDYNFEKRPQPVKDCDMTFEESEFSLPEEYESVRVGDVVKKKIDEVLEEGLTPKKMLMYLLCGAIGLSIGFLIVYFMGR